VRTTVVERRKEENVDRVDFDGWLADSTTFCSNLLLAERGWLDRERTVRGCVVDGESGPKRAI
jgi:hypothetical protein